MLKLYHCASTVRAQLRGNERATMSKKAVIAIAVSALVCGLWASSASAKHRHHRVHAAPAPAAMKAVPGNNPFPVAANRELKAGTNYEAPKVVQGNNPMNITKPK
jgi:hypothetical protein